MVERRLFRIAQEKLRSIEEIHWVTRAIAQQLAQVNKMRNLGPSKVKGLESGPIIKRAV